jgi:hypothetical protein
MELAEMPCTVYFEETERKALVGFIRKDPLAPPPPDAFASSW